MASTSTSSPQTELAFSAEELELRDSIRNWADAKVAPFAKQWDDEESFPEATFRALGELGYLGAILPEEYGGLGLNPMCGFLIMEELGRCDGGFALSYGAHAFICAYNIAKMASHEQKLKYLPDLASGKTIGAFCLTEPGSGSDSLGMATVAKEDGDSFILNGSKTFITNGPNADVFLVFARTGPAGSKGISAFIVEKTMKGVSAGQKMQKMGMRSSPTSEIYFEDVKVPRANLVGEVNQGAYLAMQGLDMERILFSGLPVGLMQSGYDIAMRYATERKQFGQAIAQFQMVQEMLTRIGLRLHTARLAALQACRLMEQGKPCTLEASYCKLYAGEAAMEATSLAIQVLGGYGYIREFPVERLMRDAKLIEIGGGTNQIQTLIIAREQFKAMGVRV